MPEDDRGTLQERDGRSALLFERVLAHPREHVWSALTAPAELHDCRLIHSFDDRFKAARDAAGWHLCLVALASALDSGRRPQPGHGAQPERGWSDLNRDYQDRLGIAPGQATPPPSR
jgi:hypothetical protein